MTPRYGWRSWLASSLVGTSLFLGCLWRLGFPQPTLDDLFYSGAALNLANGGDYSNPLLERQGFPSHYFFVYPPLHSFVLAGWLKLLGISAASMTGFAVAALFLTCAATVAILRRHQAPVWLEWLVPLGVAFAFLPTGLRPESLAVGLAMLGFAVTEWRGGSKAGLFTGFLLMFLGASCAPRVTLFAAALALCAGYKAGRDGAFGRGNRWWIWVLGLGSFLLASLIFLGLIGFRAAEFWRTFHFHAARVSGKQFDVLRDYAANFLGIWQWPLVLIPLGLLIYAARKPKDGLGLMALFVAAAFPLVAWTGGIGAGTIWWAILIMLVLAGSVAKSHSGPRVAWLQVAIIITLIVANRRLEANCLGLLTRNIGLDQGAQSQTALALRPTPEHPLLVDGAAARYVFDYRIPAGTLDLEFGTAFPGTLPGDLNSSELRQGDLFVAGPETVRLLAHSTYLEQETPKWMAFGRAAFKFEKYPRRIYIIPAENCRASRPGMGSPKIWIPKSPG